MLTPTCPNCREQMSSVEHGHGGVWSCLYCEGCWLSERNLETVARRTVPAGSSLVWQKISTPINAPDEGLTCAACETDDFETLSVNDVHAYQCTKCRGVFFRKGALAAIASNVFHTYREAPQGVGKTLAAELGANVALTILLSIFS